MSSFYDILKAAKVGGNLPSYYETLFARKLPCSKYAWTETTLTGIPPISFRAKGTPLTAYSITGNMMQTGTPAPDAPIMPTFCGDMTENLFDIVAFAENADETHATIARNGNTIILTATAQDAYINQVILDGNTTPEQYRPSCISVEPETEYTIHLSKAPKCYISWINDSFLAVANFTRITASYDPTSYTFTTPAGCTKILFRIGQETTIGTTFQFSDIMLVKGSAAPSSYIPYGYKLPITCGSQSTPVYLGQVESTRKIRKVVFDGTEQGWGKNTGLTNSNAFSISMPNWVGNRKIGYCTHYQNITDAQAAEGIYFGNSLNILTALADGLDDATKFKQWLANQYSAGTPVCVWYTLATEQTGIVNEPLAKIGAYADTIASTNTGAPSIQTVRGSNVLTVDTTLQPSEVSITGMIKEV